MITFIDFLILFIFIYLFTFGILFYIYYNKKKESDLVEVLGDGKNEKNV